MKAFKLLILTISIFLVNLFASCVDVHITPKAQASTTEVDGTLVINESTTPAYFEAQHEVVTAGIGTTNNMSSIILSLMLLGAFYSLYEAYKQKGGQPLAGSNVHTNKLFGNLFKKGAHPALGNAFRKGLAGLGNVASLLPIPGAGFIGKVAGGASKFLEGRAQGGSNSAGRMANGDPEVGDPRGGLGAGETMTDEQIAELAAASAAAGSAANTNTVSQSGGNGVTNYWNKYIAAWKGNLIVMAIGHIVGAIGAFFGIKALFGKKKW